MENTSSNVHTQETVQLPPLEVAEVGVHPAPEQSVGGRALTLSPAAWPEGTSHHAKRSTSRAASCHRLNKEELHKSCRCSRKLHRFLLQTPRIELAI